MNQQSPLASDSVAMARRTRRSTIPPSRVMTLSRGAILTAVSKSAHDCAQSQSRANPVSCADFHHLLPSFANRAHANRVGYYGRPLSCATRDRANDHSRGDLFCHRPLLSCATHAPRASGHSRGDSRDHHYVADFRFVVASRDDFHRAILHHRTSPRSAMSWRMCACGRCRGVRTMPTLTPNHGDHQHHFPAILESRGIRAHCGDDRGDETLRRDHRLLPQVHRLDRPRFLPPSKSRRDAAPP